MHIYIHMHTNINTHVRMYTYMHTFIYVYVCVCVCVLSVLHRCHGDQSECYYKIPYCLARPIGVAGPHVKMLPL